jgi:phosphoglucomutase
MILFADPTIVNPICHPVSSCVDLLSYFAAKEVPFMMECCRRTEADKKGGHLAVRAADGQLILRESAQCAKADEPAFQDVTRHQFFNTNNLWVRLDMLKSLMDSKGGFVPLPTILNGKTVDPQQVSSSVLKHWSIFPSSKVNLLGKNIYTVS